MAAVKVKKKRLLDSGANITVISTLDHSDTSSFASSLRIHDLAPEAVETADGGQMLVTGASTMLDIPALLCPTATNRLLSVSQFWSLKNAMVLFSSKGAIVIAIDPVLDRILQLINEYSFHNDLVLLTGTLTDESL